MPLGQGGPLWVESPTPLPLIGASNRLVFCLVGQWQEHPQPRPLGGFCRVLQFSPYGVLLHVCAALIRLTACRHLGSFQFAAITSQTAMKVLMPVLG